MVNCSKDGNDFPFNSTPSSYYGSYRQICTNIEDVDLDDVEGGNNDNKQYNDE